MGAGPSGRCLVIAHAASDIEPGACAELARRYNEMSSAAITLRDRGRVARFLAGLGMIQPSLVPISQRGLAGDAGTTAGSLAGYCGMGKKP
jgi:S-adenosyl methyltransferase